MSEVNKLNEGSSAADSLHPAARPVTDDPKSKIEYIQTMIGAMHTMKKNDLVSWFDQAMALIGHEADSIPSNASDANQATNDSKLGAGPKTRAPMISVGEDVEEMFAGQDLSEEFKTKAQTIFEAAVNARATLEITKLEEEFADALEERVSDAVSEIEARLDKYLDYVVESWVKENEVALQSSLRSEIMEEFISGMKTLFTEHYIDVPEEKVDVVESLASKVESLEGKLSTTISESVQLKREIADFKRKDIIGSLTEGLTLPQQSKFEALAEGVDFDGDLDTYKSKLVTIKESYFAKAKNRPTNIEEETFEGNEVTHRAVDPTINRYAAAISRTVKQ